MKSRLLRAVDYIEQEIDVSRNGSGKVVIFTGFAETHEKIMQLLQIRNLQAVAFRQGMTIDALEDSVYEFQNNPECKIMVCDETGGEGRNFQNADWIIHLDLPGPQSNRAENWSFGPARKRCTAHGGAFRCPFCRGHY